MGNKKTDSINKENPDIIMCMVSEVSPAYIVRINLEGYDTWLGTLKGLRGKHFIAWKSKYRAQMEKVIQG